MAQILRLVKERKTVDRISDIEFFQALCRFDSFKNAAQFLGITPPAVSQRLAALESRLGVSLIRRSTRSLRITEEGKFYLEKTSALLAELSQLEQSISSLRDSLQGTIRINGPFGYGRKVLGSQLAQFKKLYPNIKLDLILSDTHLDIIKGGFDVAIRVGSLKDSRLIASLIRRNKQHLCCSPKYLQNHPVNRFLDLHNVDGIMILEDELTSGTWRLTNGSRQELVKPQTTMQTNNGEVALNWALNDLGVVLRSDWDIEPYIKTGQLVKILPQWSVTADVFAVYTPDQSSAYRTQLIINFLIAQEATRE